MNLDRRHVLGAQDAEGSQCHVGREARCRIRREVLRQRVAEPHVHTALDLPFTQHRVDRFADIVDRNDPLDIAGLSIDHDELRGVAERGVDRRVGIVGVTEMLRPIDEVLAHVVDVGLAPAVECGNARVAHRACSHQRAARTGGLSEAELARRVDDDFDAIRIDAQLLCRDLQGDGVHTLAHLGPAVTYLDDAIAAESDDCAAQLAEPVPEPRVFQSQAETDRLACCASRVVVRLDRIETDLGATATVVHDLAGTPDLAGVDHVALANLPTVDADHLGEPVEHAFHCELRLVGAEAAERSTDRVVGAHGNRVNVDRRHVVRPARMTGGPFEHFHPDARVRAAVADATHAQRCEPAFGVAAGPVLEADRMSLGVDQQTLLARQGALHRPIEQPRGERGMRLVAHVFLATERPAVRHQRHGDLLVGDHQHAGDVVAVVPHTLAA